MNINIFKQLNLSCKQQKGVVAFFIASEKKPVGEGYRCATLCKYLENINILVVLELQLFKPLEHLGTDYQPMPCKHFATKHWRSILFFPGPLHNVFSCCSNVLEIHAVSSHKAQRCCCNYTEYK
ncbi:hypothetical protein GOODEAATRI_015224 [Goodea atripinnis]|uniref:Uncharacterized protein n=1 Tax=Goodea atripinnis TaxID=208336 RepID=A0ABV0PE97_9TELE